MEFLTSQEHIQELRQCRDVEYHSARCRQEVWKRPPHGWLKCNFDGSIIRDENGVYRGSGHAMDDKPN